MNNNESVRTHAYLCPGQVLGVRVSLPGLREIEERTLWLAEKIPILRMLTQKQFRLRSLVCVAVLITSFISITIAYLIVFSIYQRSFVKHADKVSDVISHQVFNSMLQLMERGWIRGELDRFLRSIKPSTGYLPKLNAKDIEGQTRTLILGTPQIGGIVGIGVQSLVVEDPLRSIVVNGMLATLLNVIGSIRAISKYTKDLEYYATRDSLTHLYNQRVLWDLLGYEIGRATRFVYKFSLLVIDIDNFKNINDSYGYAFGDKFLREFALRLKEVLRMGDILSRYGGDVFVAILPETDEEQAFQVAGRPKEHVEELFLFAPGDIKVRATVSIGISTFLNHADNTKDLFIFADNMMYKAKSEGKDRIVIPTHEEIIGVFKTISEKTLILTHAIEDKKMIPYFQPIINLKTEGIEGHEVLSRIETDRGIQDAGEFIEITERLGAIGKLDFILLEKVFEKVRDEAYKGFLFINLSPRSLILSEFIPNLLLLARKYGIDHSMVVFEITKRETVKNISLLERFVDNLTSEGFKFAIDDFEQDFHPSTT